MRICPVSLPLLTVVLWFPVVHGQVPDRKAASLLHRGLAREAKPVVADPGFGVIPKRHTPRIIGGSNAPAYPWVAGLIAHRESDLYDGLFCGGSLIHPQWVLTAAHCVQGSEPADLDVAIGGKDLDRPDTFERITVAEIIVHPRYNDLNSDSDIALLRLERPAASGHDATILLADTTELETPGRSARIIGWGSTDENADTYPRLLQQADIALVDFDDANNAYDGQLTSNMIAADGGGVTDSCYGDSGGPMVVFDDEQQRWVITGVVSFGNGCADPNSPGIYSRVTALRAFILSHIAPGYAMWEAGQGVSGRLRDPDGDGRVNWDEYLALTQPTVADVLPAPVPADGVVAVASTNYPSATFTVPDYRPEVDPQADYAPALAQPWQALDPAIHLVSRNPVHSSSEALCWRGPAPAAGPVGFFRASAVDSGVYRNGIRSFSLQAAVTGSLTAEDPVHPSLANHRQHLYTYQPGAEAGHEVRIFLHSGEFDARLELLDTTGVVLQTADNNGAGGIAGRDESLVVTPAAGVTRVLRVTTAGSGQTGRYMLGGFRSSSLAAVPAAPTAKTKDSLTTASPFDPLYEPGGGYYAKDFRIDAAPNHRWLQFTMDSAPIDAYLTLVDAETGLATGWSDDDSNGGTNARLRFRAMAGHSYLIRCTSAAPGETGAFKPRLTTATVPALVPGATVIKGKLSGSDDREFLGFTPFTRSVYAYKDLYLLSGLTVGSQVTLEMAGDKVKDPYLVLVDPVTGRHLDQNDDIDTDADNFDSRLTFTARMPEYVVIATTSGAGDMGTYTISARTP